MRRVIVVGFVVLCAASPLPSEATDVIFSGTVANTCDLSVMLPTTGGTMTLSSDGTILGSDQGGGVGVTLTIGSIGTNHIDVGAPTLTNSPAGYSTTGQSLQMGYTATGTLAGLISNKAMGTGGGSFNAGILGLTAAAILIQARIVNPNGFKLGDYELTTVVTCS